MNQMKQIIKKLALLLSVILVISVTGCNKPQKLQVYNTADTSPESQITVALNPVISYSDSKYGAFEQVSNTLATDLSEEDYTLSENSSWSWMFYDEEAQKWVPRNGRVSNWTPVNKTATKAEELPYSYAYTDNGTTSLTPYLKSSIRVSPYGDVSAPKHGVLLTVTGKYEEGLCFIAPKSGKINITDPDSGVITAVEKVIGAETATLLNDFCDRAFQIIFYHNGKPIWAAEMGNPRHYNSEDEADGCYSVEFPELKDISVKEGDLISIVVKNISDTRTALTMLPKAAKKYTEASKVVTKNGKSYIEHRGEPYLLYGVQVRLDRAITAFKVATAAEYDKYIEPYFAKTAEVGFKTVIFPIHWKQIEVTKDTYSFNLLKIYYDYAKKYDLNVQLLWFGSDVCGWGSNSPNYIWEDTKTYSRLIDYPEVLNLYDADTIEREMLAFGKLLEWLYEYDTDMRTVCIQLENEANATAASGPETDSWTDKDTVDATTWVAGQKQAVYNIMDALGRMVKSGPYRCVTRTNLVYYQCLYNGVNNHQIEEVASLEGMDLVGIDSYQSSLGDRVIEQTDLPGNIPHYAEFGANYYIVPAHTLMSLSRGGGLLIYQLKAVDKDAGYEVFAGDKYEWLYRTSEKVLTKDKELVYGLDTNELTAFNKMLWALGQQVTAAPKENIGAFNCTSAAHTLSAKQTLTVAGKSVTYTSNSNDYGGSGLAVCTEDGEWLLLAHHTKASFTFDGINISGNVSVGRYSDGKWVEESTVVPNGGTVTITPEIISTGAILRITSDQLK